MYRVEIIQVEDNGFFFCLGNEVGATKPKSEIVFTGEESCSVSVDNTLSVWVYEVSDIGGQPEPTVVSNALGKLVLEFSSQPDMSFPA